MNSDGMDGFSPKKTQIVDNIELNDSFSYEIDNKVPFSNNKLSSSLDLSADPQISFLIQNYHISVDQLRNSSSLKKMLSDIILKINFETEDIMHYGSYQSMKVSLNTLMRLLVSQLCIPHMMMLVGMGSGTGISKMISENLTSIVTTDFHRHDKDTESTEKELSLIDSAKLIIVETFTLLKLSMNCSCDQGYNSLLHNKVCRVFFLMIKYHCSPMLPHAITVKEYGPDALQHLSCHILNVSVIVPCVHESIKLVTKRLSLALESELKSHSIETMLPELEVILCDYFEWLRENRDYIIKECRIAEVIASVDSSVRAWMKNENYSSSFELKTIYYSKYKDKITHIPLPLQSFKKSCTEQMIKDIIRENIIVNNIEYKITCENCNSSIHAIRNEIKKVLVYLFGFDDLNDADNVEYEYNCSEISTTNSDNSSVAGMNSEHPRTLLAASRTFAGGDAYLILNDLYGGIGLTLCPINNNHTTSSSSLLTKVTITANGISVTVRERYSLYASNDLEYCLKRSSVKSLADFECITTSIIILSKDHWGNIESNLRFLIENYDDNINNTNYSNNSNYFQLNDNNSTNSLVEMLHMVRSGSYDYDHPSNNKHCYYDSYQLYLLLISNPEVLCHRTVTIKPI
eukprot:gene5060-7063_t